MKLGLTKLPSAILAYVWIRVSEKSFEFSYITRSAINAELFSPNQAVEVGF